MQFTVSIGRAAMLLGVSVVTMRRWDKVSSHDQKADLVRQSQRLKKLLTMIVSGQMSKLILMHKDRLLRFGHELVFHLCALFSVEVEVIEVSKEDTFEVELTKDVITLMTVFSARLYGKRSHQNKMKSITS
jgi:putative resolvase